MRAALIKSKISQYDRNKGYFRTLKDEPHIKELREFCNRRLESIDGLSPPLLLELAIILQGKKDRDGDSESSQIFRELVCYFGGYDVLDRLKNHGQLSAETVAFLGKHNIQANLLVPLLISICQKLPSSIKTIMFDAMEKMSDTEYAVLYFETLNFLNQNGIYTEDVIPLLSEVKQLVNIKQTLEVLHRVSPQLFNRDHVISILKLQNPYYFARLLDLLSDTQDNLNSLFSVDGILDKCSQAEKIIKNFKSAGWELSPYLKYILSVDGNGLDLELATSRLKEITIKPELLSLILETIFLRSNESIALVNAVTLLNDENLVDDLLKAAFATKYPDRVAEALVALKKAECGNKQTHDVVCSQPEYAIELAQAMIQLYQINRATTGAYNGIVKYPQSADKVARVIEYLRKNSFVDNPNNRPEAYKGLAKRTSDKFIIAVCKAGLTDDSLIKLFEVMKAAEILDMSNLHKLTPRLKYVKTLASAANCLANGNKFNQFNFDKIISDPINAIALAEKLGGIPSPPSLPQMKDEGAKDFVEIRKSAKILSQGQRQGLFFTNLENEKIKSFEAATRRKMAAIQNETMIKIAEYTSEHHLENTTEHHIANNSYFSVLRSK